MAISSLASEQLIGMAPSDLRSTSPRRSRRLRDSHPPLFNPEEFKPFLFQVAYY